MTIGGAFLWRLHRGPIEANEIIPYIVHAFAIPESEAKLKIGSAVLAWGEAARPVKLVVKDFSLRNKDGVLISSVPEMSLSFSFAALLRGTIALRTLAVHRPFIRLYIAKDGSISSTPDALPKPEGKSAETEAETPFPVWDVIAFLEKDVYISRFSLLDARIRVTDEYHNVEWEIPKADLTYAEKRSRNTLTGRLKLTTRKKPLNVNILAEWGKNKSDMIVTVGVKNINVSGLSVAKKYPVLQQLSTPVDIETATRLDIAPVLKSKRPDDWRDAIQRIEFRIKGGAGRVLLPDPVIADFDLKNFSLKGAWYDKGDKFDLTGFELQMNTGRAFGNISVRGLGKAFDTHGWESISADMNATVLDVPVDKLPSYWPAVIEPEIHDWVRDNMHGGTIHEGTFALHFIGLKDESGIDCDRVAGTVNISGTNVTYMEGMPAVENVAGTLDLTRQTVDIHINQGATYGVSVTKGLVSFYNLEKEFSDGKVVLDLEGSLKDALTILDQPPLDLTREIGVRPEKTKGLVKGTLTLDFPIGDAFTSDEQVKVNADAEIKNASLKDIVLDYGLQQASMTLKVREKDVGLTGTGMFFTSPADFSVKMSFDRNKQEKTDISFNTSLNDATRAHFDFGSKLLVPPSVSGNVKAALRLKGKRSGSATVKTDFDLKGAEIFLRPVGWKKPLNTHGKGSVTLLLKDDVLTDVPDFSLSDAAGNAARGKLTFDEKGDLKELLLDSVKTGRTDAKARIRFGDNSLKFDLSGASLDISGLIAGDSSEAKEKKEAKREKSERAHPEKSLLINAALDKVWLSSKGYTENNALFAKRNESAWEKIKAVGLVGQNKIPLHFSLSPNGDGTEYVYSLASEDAGGSLAALDYISSIRGGKLQAEGKYDPKLQISFGTLKVSEFRMVEMPVLSRILMLTSLTGIVDMFKGEGLAFDSAEIPYSITDAAVAIKDGVVAGSSLGITLSGKYYRDSGYFNMRGSLVPFYTLNSFLGKIPLIGKLFAGEKGGGLIAPTYTVKGKLPSPHISVNAFSALAPGAVRELLGKIANSDEDLSKKDARTQTPSQPSPSVSSSAKTVLFKSEELPPPLQKTNVPAVKKAKEKELTDSLQRGE